MLNGKERPKQAPPTYDELMMKTFELKSKEFKNVLDCWKPEMRMKPPGSAISISEREDDFECVKEIRQQLIVPNCLPWYKSLIRASKRYS